MTLISDEYRILNAKHHFNRPEWGRQSMKYWETVKSLADQVGTKTMLDYGCGKQSLKAALEPFGYRVIGYDPAFGELSASPDPANLVICTDVLEHVEPECLDAVIADLVRVTKGVGLFIVATRESRHKLPDGSSPHRIVKPKEWWLDIFQTNFKVLQELNVDDNVFGVVVGRK